MLKLLSKGLLALTLCACSTASERPENSADPALADQLADFLTIFPGRYDSYQQTIEDLRNAVSPELRNYRRHSIFRQVDLPAFGDTVVLAHQYRDGDPSKVYRHRLYTFALIPERDAFRLRVHVPKDPTILRGAYRDPSILSDLIPDDFTVWDGCDLYWQREADRFVGRLDPGTCRFDSEAFGQTIILEEVLTLSDDRITFADRGLSLDGQYLFGMRGDVPNISLKSRSFICEDSERTAWLHDQGGQSDALGYDIKLERLTRGSPQGLRLTVPRSGQRHITVLASPDAKQISAEVGADIVTCRHAPDRLYSEG